MVILICVTLDEATQKGRASCVLSEREVLSMTRSGRAAREPVGAYAHGGTAGLSVARCIGG